MSDIEIACTSGLDEDVAREQPSDILNQMAFATMMLRLELDLLAFVRALNAAEANTTPAEQEADPQFAVLLRRLVTLNVPVPQQPPYEQLQHNAA
jgi:hypothetical protein